MNRHAFFAISALTCAISALLCAACAPAAAQNAPVAAAPVVPIDRSMLSVPASPGRDGVPFPEGPICGAVSRSARPMSTKLVLGEPLVIELRFEGKSLSEEKGSISFSNRLGASVRVFATPADPRNGGTVEISPYRNAPLTPQAGLELALGQKFDARILCAHDPNTRSGSVFDASGTYLIQAAMNCVPKDPVAGEAWESIGAFVVDVAAPEAPDDVLAWQIVKPWDVYSAVQNQIVSTKEQLAVLDRLVDEAPKSRIRPFALMALARTALADFPTDPKLLDRCEKLLDTIVADHPDHLLAREAAELLIRVYSIKGDEEAARRVFVDEFWTNPLGARMMPPANPLVMSYMGPPADPVGGQWMMFVRPRDAVAPPRSAESDLMRQALGDELADKLGEPVGFKYQ